MHISVLGSGSSGNCLVVEAEGERLVLDAGMGPNRAAERMRSIGRELFGQGAPPPLGVVVTHEHGDHAAHALPLGRARRAPVYAHDVAAIGHMAVTRASAWASAPAPSGERAAGAQRAVPVRGYTPGQPLVLGPFVVEALPIPHDAPHVALRVTAGRHRFAIATDVGHVRRDLRDFLASCDLVFLEANYCPELLEIGPYPPRLKRRVGGPL
ncbi:MAG: MBL fold metallo-hydrolase, partial [Myxococcales bacterium]|nr:MBL fold metallo-hydrolase [Myxococcales bacterium]